MKLKNYVLVTILLFTLIIAGCSSSKDDENTQITTQSESDDVLSETELEDSDMTPQDSIVSDESMTSDELDNENLDEDIDDEADLDVSLFDRALLESVDVNIPDSLMTISEGIINDTPETIVNYKKGYNSRTESIIDGITEIDIYNYDEGLGYSYTLGEPDGYMYVLTEEDKADSEAEMEINGTSLMKWLEDEMSFSESTTITASQEKVNGRKTILITIAEESTSEDENSSVFQIWFDKEYTVAMKYIMDFGAEWNYSMEVVDFEFNQRLNDDLFMPPNDINFD